MKPIKRISPLESIESMFDIFGSESWKLQQMQNNALTDIIGDITIDTAKPMDTDTWETSIKHGNGDWVIVEQYEDDETAKLGHNAWVEKIQSNPEIELEDIDVIGIKKFIIEESLKKSRN